LETTVTLGDTPQGLFFHDLISKETILC